MKKVLIGMICMILVLSVTACGGTSGTGSSAEDKTAGSPDISVISSDEAEPGVELPVQTAPESLFAPVKNNQKAPDDVKKVSELDADFAQKTDAGVVVQWNEAHIQHCGTASEDRNTSKPFYRLLYSDYSKYPSAVANHALRTAGERLRFRTDSKKVTLNAVFGAKTSASDNRSQSSNNSFDVYAGCGADKKYIATLIPPSGSASFSETFELSGEMQDITVEFPCFIEVVNVSFTLDADSSIGSPTPYTHTKPVVYYGSSITHGLAATKAANQWPALLSRVLDTDYINLGFSGAAHGEEIIAKYIAGIDMSVFVLDYDYNASGVAELRNTHYNFYRIVREAHPDVPIIIMTMANLTDSYMKSAGANRRAVIRETYDRAVAAGDKNVYFVSGQYTYPSVAMDLCLNDGTHPTDTGAYYMAYSIYEILKAVLEGTPVPAAHSSNPGMFYKEAAAKNGNDDKNAVKVDELDPQYVIDTLNGIGIGLNEPHIEVTGLTDGMLRINPAVSASRGLKASASKTAGARIRFRTDSQTVSVKMRLASVDRECRCVAINGANGLDCYTGNGTRITWKKTLTGITAGALTYQFDIELDGTMQDVVINLPVEASVLSVKLYFKKGSLLASPTKSETEAPVVFCGSQYLTHTGVCRPGTSAAQVATRAMGADLLDFGFDVTDDDYALLISSLESTGMSAFVLAYGGQNTDESFFSSLYSQFRAKHPDTPFLFVTGVLVDPEGNDCYAAVRAAVAGAYRSAVGSGDKNVYILDGNTVLPTVMRDLCTQDGSMLNDLGHYYLAKAYYGILASAINKK